MGLLLDTFIITLILADAFTVHEDIGRSNWITLYFTGGVFGSLFSLWSHVLMKRFDVTTYGASGAVWAIMAAWAYVTIG